MIFVGTERFIADILEEHFETLEHLWERRCSILRDPVETLRRLRDLDDRIAAHTDGLVLAESDASDIVMKGLEKDETGAVLAAAMVMQLSGLPGATAQVSAAFQKAKGKRLDGLTKAMRDSPVDSTLADCRKAIAGPSEEHALAAAEILAFARELREDGCLRLNQLAQSGNPDIRRGAWRVVCCAEPRADTPFQIGAVDADLSVRMQALEAAAWSRQGWLLPHLRGLAGVRDATAFNALYLLAVLAQPEDLKRILEGGNSTAFGPRRFRILGACGHPAAVDSIIAGISSDDPATAVAAGAAFMRITGFDIESNTRVALAPEDGHEPDDFEKEFLDEATLPSAAMATEHWKQTKDRYATSTRWSRGVDLGAPLGDRDLVKLDLESRWEHGMRQSFAGIAGMGCRELDRYPQVRPKL